MKKHWQDWGNLVLGLWIFISPWVLQHSMVTGAEAVAGATSIAAMWNLYIVGIAVAAFAVAALVAFQAWEEWTNVALGIWLIASLWVPGLNASTLLIWNAVIAGTLVVVLAGWRIAPPQDSSKGPAKHA